MSIKIKVERELSDEFVGDVLVTAFDGRYGGCWYWAAPKVAEGDTSWLDYDVNDVWLSVNVVDKEDANDSKIYRVNAEVIQVGIQRIIDATEVKINEEIRNYILRGVLEEDGGDIDSTAADCIVQAGLFNEIVYG